MVALLPLRRRRAVVSVRVLRRLSAWALPRPSAMASAKLANSTVNHSQTMTWPENSRLPCPPKRSRRNRMVATSETTAVMKITGLRARLRGSSLRKASFTAGPTRAGSNSEGAVLWVVMDDLRSVQGSGEHRVVLDDGAQGQGREVGEAADDQHHADQQRDEQ